MRLLRGVTAALGGAVLLTGCAGMELDKAKGVAAEGSTFQRALYQEYLGLAEHEFGEGDYVDSDLFARKAEDAAAGDTVLPEDPAAHKVPADKVKLMTAAMGRLVEVLDADARDKFPEIAAHAQVQFDCWVEEQAENREIDEILACRSEFEATLDKLRKWVMPVKTAAAAPQPATQAAAAETTETVATTEEEQAAEPAPLMVPSFFILFDFNSAKIDARGQQMVRWVAAQVKKTSAKRVLVSGHTDTKGSKAYNRRLAERRANAVAKALVAAGVPDKIVIVTATGEDEPRIKTADNVRERQNRVVQITLIK